MSETLFKTIYESEWY